ncbi:hypothetical protein F2Q70_00041919 [Brassica cretica]|uniref:Uncharacterized protein n=1 Tax=Brassica cretica TaxID=69181 RepID=A0A8S9KD86_BRACR|nr:hypothetical protein F2Q70_00041919 [Brassica cretica]
MLKLLGTSKETLISQVWLSCEGADGDEEEGEEGDDDDDDDDDDGGGGGGGGGHIVYEPTGDRAMEALHKSITDEYGRGRLPY